MTRAAVPSPEELLARAQRLAPVLAERAAKAAELRRVPDETIADFRDAGLFRILQPARYGGYELDPQLFFDVQIALACACPSSAWVFGVLGVHAWQLALFAEQAQDDVWGADSSVLVSSSYAPTGRIEAAPGGFRVSGRWSFSSGCDHAKWVFLGGFAPAEPDAKAPDMRTFLLPRGDYCIEDNWHVIGLQGTGSKDIVVDGAFVPEHRTHRLIDGFRRKSPGNELNRAPLYRLPFGQIFVRSVSTSAIGCARGALDAFRDTASKRIAASDGAKVAVEPITQSVCAQAEASIDEVCLVLRRNFDEMMRLVRDDQDIPVERRVKFRYESALAVEKCVRAVDDLFTASGGRAIFSDSKLARFFLDVHAARAHYANGPDKPGRNFGAVQLGLKNADFFI
jgi:3-hydroxy-9,10-secoandrosta-1,3,5(10)-triene-9,17-dione monooxygenase